MFQPLSKKSEIFTEIDTKSEKVFDKIIYEHTEVDLMKKLEEQLSWIRQKTKNQILEKRKFRNLFWKFSKFFGSATRFGK